MSRNRGFLYHAYALGVSGQLDGKPVAPQAASALPPAGGQSSAHWADYQLKDYFRYDQVSSKTEGMNRGRDHHVVATSSIRNLKIGTNVTADAIEVHLEASHANETEEAPRFTLTPDSTYFRNIVIAGRQVKLTPLFPPADCLTEDIRGKFHEMMSQRKPPVAPPAPPEDVVGVLKRIFAWFRNDRDKDDTAYQDVTVLPLFRIENPSEPGAFEVDGNVIHVPGFGYIQLGQLIMRKDEWRVTMVQVHLGEIKSERESEEDDSFGFDGASGDLTCLSVGSNGGHTDPP